MGSHRVFKKKVSSLRSNGKKVPAATNYPYHSNQYWNLLSIKDSNLVKKRIQLNHQLSTLSIHKNPSMQHMTHEKLNLPPTVSLLNLTLCQGTPRGGQPRESHCKWPDVSSTHTLRSRCSTKYVWVHEIAGVFMRFIVEKVASRSDHRFRCHLEKVGMNVWYLKFLGSWKKLNMVDIWLSCVGRCRDFQDNDSPEGFRDAPTHLFWFSQSSHLNLVNVTWESTTIGDFNSW